MPHQTHHKHRTNAPAPAKRSVAASRVALLAPNKSISQPACRPACAVVAEAEVAIVLADAYLEKFGHDNMTDIKAAVKSYRQRLRTLSR